MKLLFFVAVFSLPLQARVYEIDLTGLSFHLNAAEAYPQAPRRLDPLGQFVFNPGIGLAADFRENVAESGFSPSIRLGFFRDCDDRNIFYGGAGVRYSLTIGNILLVGAGLSVFLASGEDWATGNRNIIILPYPNVEFGFAFSSNVATRMHIAFAPAGSAISATAGSSLLFTTVSVSFSEALFLPPPPPPKP